MLDRILRGSPLRRTAVTVALVGAVVAAGTGCDEVIEEDCFEQQGTLTQVTTDTLTVDHFDAALSPDGTRIAFSSDYWTGLDRFQNADLKQGGQRDIAVIEVPGPDENRPPTDRLENIGDARRIDFTGVVDVAGQQIDTVNSFKSEVAWVDNQTLAVTMTDFFGFDRIFLVELGPRTDLDEISVIQRGIVEEEFLEENVENRRIQYFHRTPAVSPNGEWIAYSRFFLDLGANLFDDADDEFSQPAIHAYNLNDGRIVRVTNGSLREDQPTWSPDGRFIAFTANLGAAGQPEIYRVPFDPDDPAEPREPGGSFTDGRLRLTTTVDQLKLPESSMDPTWLRSGEIVFTSTQRPPCTSRRIRNLWIMNGDGSNRRPLVVSDEDDNFPFAANYDFNDPMADDMIVFSSRRNPDDSFKGQKMDLWVLRGGF